MADEQSGEQSRRGAADHLKPHQWKKGQSGNPKGRPKGRISLVRLIEDHLMAEDGKVAHEIVEHLFCLARSGDSTALKAIMTIMDRVDGAVSKKQVIELTDLKTKLVRLFDGDDEDGEEEGSDEEAE